jgi:hypothetical protein
MFRPIFQVIYHKILHIYCGEFAAFWGNFMYFWRILGDFYAKFFFFQFELATLIGVLIEKGPIYVLADVL